MLKLSFSLVVMTFLISGCANWFPTEKREVASTPAVSKESRPVIREALAPKREPGSIWSESSSWNVLYAPPHQRMLGDVIILRPSDTFRISVARRGGGSGNDTSQGGRENTQILAVVKEILPRQVYRIEAKQSIRIGVKDQDIELAGKIREQDISADETGSTDALYDVELKVNSENPATLASSEANASRQIASTKGGPGESPGNSNATAPVNASPTARTQQ